MFPPPDQRRELASHDQPVRVTTAPAWLRMSPSAARMKSARARRLDGAMIGTGIESCAERTSAPPRVQPAPPCAPPADALPEALKYCCAHGLPTRSRSPLACTEPPEPITEGFPLRRRLPSTSSPGSST